MLTASHLVFVIGVCTCMCACIQGRHSVVWCGVCTLALFRFTAFTVVCDSSKSV